MWQHLERLGGGVGTRGPGESQLESDRRMARRRISQLRARLKALRAQRGVRRKERKRAEVPTVALAGYTNVGKSTLLNALTGADVSVENRLFETLDPTTRSFEHDGKRYLVTDTVGFIRRLPTQLVQGFASTLEETLVADLILHVADASLPEDRLREQIAAVERRADRDRRRTSCRSCSSSTRSTASTRSPGDGSRTASPRRSWSPLRPATGLDELRERIAELFADRFEDVRLLVPYDEGTALSALYALGAPIDERRDTDAGVLIRAKLSHRDTRRFARYLVAGDDLESAATT